MGRDKAPGQAEMGVLEDVKMGEDGRQEVCELRIMTDAVQGPRSAMYETTFVVEAARGLEN